MLHLIADLAVYSFFPKKPSIKTAFKETDQTKNKYFNSKLLLAA
jgi:hypothetical protein